MILCGNWPKTANGDRDREKERGDGMGNKRSHEIEEQLYVIIARLVGEQGLESISAFGSAAQLATANVT